MLSCAGCFVACVQWLLKFQHVKQGGIGTTENSSEPYKEKFGLRFLVKCEEVKFKLQAPFEGESEVFGQVRSINYVLTIWGLQF